MSTEWRARLRYDGTVQDHPLRGAAPALSANQVNALIHLYRAEVGRMTTYRVRLDTTTNWAITTSALIATFALGNAAVPHTAILVSMLLNYFFLHLEARRFRAYEASRARVRFLERSFYLEVLGGEAEPGWYQRLTLDLQAPGPPVSRAAALGWRLRRNYLWIYAVVLLVWLSKLDVASEATLDLGRLAAHAVVGSVPGWLVCLAVAGLYASLAALALRAGRWHPIEDD